MRRGSYTPLPTQPLSEPLIVVEESGGTDEEDTESRSSSPHLNLHTDSPLLNPCLLSPYRDMRKHSLPTPACTSGITASQVRRLSEHGAENCGPSSREAAFLATLSSAATPTQGGRRHSVVTISRAPPPSIMFGRGRRESIAAFPSNTVQGRVLPNRRDSTSSVPRPPSTSSSTGGSTFNLQLDIMDDIAEIKAARKVRLKMWQTPGHERFCEVEQLDDGAAGISATCHPPTRYHQNAGTSSTCSPPTWYHEEAGTSCSPPTRFHQQAGPSSQGDAAVTPISRRYSEFISASPQASQNPRRRASELVPNASTKSVGKPPTAGIVCSNTDLISILSSLASSAQEINQKQEDSTEIATVKPKDLTHLRKNSAVTSVEQKRKKLKDLRSNSFDISMLLGTSNKVQQLDGKSTFIGPASWFTKRHQPMASKKKVECQQPASKNVKTPSATVVSLKEEKPKMSVISPGDIPTPESTSAPCKKEDTVTKCREEEPSQSSPVLTPDDDNKVVWDENSGSIVDAQVLGSAIEVFLARRGSGNDNNSVPSPPQPSKTKKALPAKTSPTNTGSASGSANGSGPGNAKSGTASSWFATTGNKEHEEEEASASDTCDNSLCSTLKDLFVK